jgi:hypothetical protein
MAPDDLEHARAATADPDRRATPLEKLGIEPRMLKLIKLAFKVDRAVAFPEETDYLERFLETADRFLEIETVGNAILRLAAAKA